MAIRTTVELPDALYERLTGQAQHRGISIRDLIVQALELTYAGKSEPDNRITGPMIRGRSRKGPRFPVDETPHDLILP